MADKLQAVLDIGSNTIRLLIVAKSDDASFRRVHYQHKIARLGEGLQTTGMLGQAGQSRAIAAFEEIIEACESHGVAVADIKAVATAAVREAGNGRKFVQQVLAQTGLRIEVISGDDEALLALKGTMFGLPADITQNMLLFDIGGGSTEFSLIQQGVLKSSISLKLGVVRLTELHLKSDPVTAAEYHAMKSATEKFLNELEHCFAAYAMPAYLVGTAGTVTTLAAIAQNMSAYDAELINGYEITTERFTEIRNQLLQMKNAQRLAVPGLEQGREDVMVAGLAIIESLLEKWHYDRLISVDSGLLEGLLE